MSGLNTRRSTSGSIEEEEEFHHVIPVGIPRYDAVHEFDDEENIPVEHYHDDRKYVTEIEIKSLRGSTTGSTSATASTVIQQSRNYVHEEDPYPEHHIDNHHETHHDDRYDFPDDDHTEHRLELDGHHELHHGLRHGDHHNEATQHDNRYDYPNDDHLEHHQDVHHEQHHGHHNDSYIDDHQQEHHREVQVGAVTVGNVVNTRSAGPGSSPRRYSSKKDSAPPIPLPLHPAQEQHSAQQEIPPTSISVAEPKKPKSPPNPEMEFDLNGKAIEPILQHKMNMDDRDEHDEATYLRNTNFFSVFHEPSEEYHSIACVWTLSFKIFEIVRIYSYKILTLIFGLLIAVISGFLFALFAFVNIWIIRPALHLVRAALSQILFIWPVFLMYVVRPWFYACGAVFSTARLHVSKGDQVTEVWEKHIHHV